MLNSSAIFVSITDAKIYINCHPEQLMGGGSFKERLYQSGTVRAYYFLFKFTISITLWLRTKTPCKPRRVLFCFFFY